MLKFFTYSLVLAEALSQPDAASVLVYRDGQAVTPVVPGGQQ